VTSPVPVTTGTLAVPGARLHYELRGSGPLLAIVSSPMTAAPFTPLAELPAAGHTVLTTDPRGHGTSALDDPEQDSTPRLRADDLARIIRHPGRPAAVIGGSGGAVTALALVQADPGMVTTAVAHEPPLAKLLETRKDAARALDDMVATYLAGDTLGAWRKFVAFAGVAMPEKMLQQSFGGGRDRELLAGDRYFFAHELRGTCRWVPDIEVLHTSATRLVAGIGDTSPIPLCDKASRALTARLDIEPTLFPGGHDGMLADPAKFAAPARSHSRELNPARPGRRLPRAGTHCQGARDPRRPLMPLSPQNNLKGTAVDVSR
jgi:pimeloyl-ACP methyl ester carboxylesterase